MWEAKILNRKDQAKVSWQQYKYVPLIKFNDVPMMYCFIVLDANVLFDTCIWIVCLWNLFYDLASFSH